MRMSGRAGIGQRKAGSRVRSRCRPACTRHKEAEAEVEVEAEAAEAEAAAAEEEAEEGDDGDGEETDGEMQCLLHALRATDESDHEVWYDLGARAHDLGDTREALRLYERACALNG